MSTVQERAERSLITMYRKELWSRFVRAVREYELIEEGDSVAVCLSGGKDSMLLAKCMQELQRHGETVEKNPCYLCARMRRGYLYEEAKKLGCNKIALGHHFDDAIETILMGVLYSGQMQGMPPKLHSTSHPGMQLIRPLYHVHERDIERWRDHCGLRFLACACRFTERCETHEEDSKRREVKRLIAKLKENNQNVDISIFRSAYNVRVDTLIEYESCGVRHGFCERFRERGERAAREEGEQ